MKRRLFELTVDLLVLRSSRKENILATPFNAINKLVPKAIYIFLPIYISLVSIFSFVHSSNSLFLFFSVCSLLSTSFCVLWVFLSTSVLVYLSIFQSVSNFSFFNFCRFLVGGALLCALTLLKCHFCFFFNSTTLIFSLLRAWSFYLSRQSFSFSFFLLLEYVNLFGSTYFFTSYLFYIDILNKFQSLGCTISRKTLWA